MLLDLLVTWKLLVSQDKLQLCHKLGVLAVLFVEPKGTRCLGYGQVERHTGIISLYVCWSRINLYAYLYLGLCIQVILFLGSSVYLLKSTVFTVPV